MPTQTQTGSADTVAVLIAARAKIENPENWGKGRRNHGRRMETCCAAEAIEEVPEAEDLAVRKGAFAAFRAAAGFTDRWGSFVDWNDAPERTHAEVLSAFDRAIAAEQAKTGAQS